MEVDKTKEEKHMNNIYLSVKPIRRHYSEYGLYSVKKVNEEVRDFFENTFGIYLLIDDVIILNTKAILKQNINVNQIIDHEMMHYILNRHIELHTLDDGWDLFEHEIYEYIGLNYYE